MKKKTIDFKSSYRKKYNYLWYLTEETAALVFFDDTLQNNVKQTICQLFSNESMSNLTKYFTILLNDICQYFSGILVIQNVFI